MVYKDKQTMDMRIRATTYNLNRAQRKGDAVSIQKYGNMLREQTAYRNRPVVYDDEGNPQDDD